MQINMHFQQINSILLIQKPLTSHGMNSGGDEERKMEPAGQLPSTNHPLTPPGPLPTEHNNVSCACA